MGASAFTKAQHIAFSTPNPSLHTVAHEVAHSLEQKAGISVHTGVGSVGDKHERHADNVADAVVRGEDASTKISPHRGSATGVSVVQKVTLFGWKLRGRHWISPNQQQAEQQAEQQRQQAQRHSLEAAASSRIGAAFRGKEAKQNLRKQKTAVATISASARRRKAQNEYKATQNFAAATGKLFRGKKDRRHVEDVREGQADLNRQEHDQDLLALATQKDDTNQDREVRGQVTDTGAYGNELADFSDTIMDHEALTSGEATKGSWGQSPGDADHAYDAPVGFVGAGAESMEVVGNWKDRQGAKKKIGELKVKKAGLTGASGQKHDNIDTQLKTEDETRNMATRRMRVAGLGVVAKVGEGVQHLGHGIANTGIDPIGISVGSEAAAAGEEFVRARHAFSRQRALGMVPTAKGERTATEEGRLEQLQSAHKAVQAGTAPPEEMKDHWDTINRLLGRSDAETSKQSGPDQDEIHKTKEHHNEDQLHEIHGRMKGRQTRKGRLAAASGVGHAVSALGSITGGTEMGVTKMVGTATTLAAGTARTGHGISQRYADYMRLAVAKNHAQQEEGVSNPQTRGKAWAVKQTAGDALKVAQSWTRRKRTKTVVDPAGVSQQVPYTSAEWRAEHGHRTLEESAQNFRSVMMDTKADEKKKYGNMYKFTGPSIPLDTQQHYVRPMSHTKAKMLHDMASRQNRLDASHMVDAASGQKGTNETAQQFAHNSLQALDVGRNFSRADPPSNPLAVPSHQEAERERSKAHYGGGPEGHEPDEDTRKALIESVMQRGDLRR